LPFETSARCGVKPRDETQPDSGGGPRALEGYSVVPAGPRASSAEPRRAASAGPSSAVNAVRRARRVL